MTGQVLYEQVIQNSYMAGIGVLCTVLLDVFYEIGRQAKWTKYRFLVTEFIVVLLCGKFFCVFLIIRYHGLLQMYSLFVLLMAILAYYSVIRPYSVHLYSIIAQTILLIYRKTTSFIFCPCRMLYRHVCCKVKKQLLQIKKNRSATATIEDVEHIHMEEII